MNCYWRCTTWFKFQILLRKLTCYMLYSYNLYICVKFREQHTSILIILWINILWVYVQIISIYHKIQPTQFWFSPCLFMHGDGSNEWAEIHTGACFIYCPHITKVKSMIRGILKPILYFLKGGLLQILNHGSFYMQSYNNGTPDNGDLFY